MIIDKLFYQFAAPPPGCEKKFLGLIAWYHYLPPANFGRYDGSTPPNLVPGTKCDITKFTFFGTGSDLPLVLAAVIDDLLSIAGLVALIFVIYGSINFITSEGNPDNAARARSTIINALAGLAISITAILFVNFLGTRFGS